MELLGEVMHNVSDTLKTSLGSMLADKESRIISLSNHPIAAHGQVGESEKHDAISTSNSKHKRPQQHEDLIPPRDPRESKRLRRSGDRNVHTTPRLELAEKFSGKITG